jgi:hypothetical protein
MDGLEALVRELQEQARLADARVADDDVLEEVSVGHLALHALGGCVRSSVARPRLFRLPAHERTKVLVDCLLPCHEHIPSLRSDRACLALSDQGQSNFTAPACLLV